MYNAMTFKLKCFRFIATPIGQAYGLRERPPSPPEKNELLEKAFSFHRKVLPNHKTLLVSILGFNF